MDEKEGNCYICNKPLTILTQLEQVCVDGSGWFEIIPILKQSSRYCVVDGISCLPVAVCPKCKPEIQKLVREKQVIPWSTITIDGEPITSEKL